jgi:septal ring factor EnvC (AmiA/AmiB activator)
VTERADKPRLQEKAKTSEDLRRENERLRREVERLRRENERLKKELDAARRAAKRPARRSRRGCRPRIRGHPADARVGVTDDMAIGSRPRTSTKQSTWRCRRGVRNAAAQWRKHALPIRFKKSCR